MRSETLAVWLLTFALHAGVLLLLAWLLDRGRLRAQLAWRELLWRGALFGALFSASLQVFSGMPAPARFAFASAAPIAVAEIPRQPVAAVGEAGPARVARVEPVATVVPAASVAAAFPSTAAPASVAFTWPSWPAIVVAAWLAGVLLVLARLAVAWSRLERRLGEARPMTRPALAADAMSLAIAAGTATPRLAVSDDLGSPVAALGRRIVMPGWAFELLDRDQLAAMLAHEVAHLARRDPLWKLLAALGGALLWFLPFTALARRRLDEIAELRCDQWAASHLGDGRALAECLAECAHHHLGGIDADLVPAMAHRDSPLVERIDHLIEGRPLDTTCTFARGAFAATLALALAAFALPGFSAQAQAPVPPSPPSPPSAPTPPAPPSGETRVSRHSGGMFGLMREATTVEINDGGERYSAKIRGKVEFNERDDDIARMDDGATASFEQTTRGTTRRIDFSSRDGAIERRYFVDGREQAIDEQGRAWVAGLVPTIVRETAINAGPRVRRMHAAGGADAVLDEIGRIRSGYSRSAHLQELYPLAKLTPAQATRVIGIIDGIDSDYEVRNALAALAAANPLDAGQQLLVLAQAGKIDSDYERAELLVDMLPRMAPGTQVRAAWLAAGAGIGSDYEHRRTLEALLETGNFDDATLAEVVEAAKSIGSDYERRTLLVGAVERIGDADRIASTYVAAASDIGSDYERREALLALVNAPKFGAAGARAVLDAADGIGSDHERVEVLVGLARVMPADAALIARYREVARELSDHERGTAERALDRFAG